MIGIVKYITSAGVQITNEILQQNFTYERNLKCKDVPFVRMLFLIQ